MDSPTKQLLRRLKFLATEDHLTDAAGLGSLIELFDQSSLKQAFIACLPERTSHRSVGAYQMALTMLASFIHGHDCLEDLDHFRNDPSLIALFGSPTAAARTHGDFLRDFEPDHIVGLNRFLNTMARHIFSSFQVELPPEHRPQDLVIDIDSTSHVQTGDKMEGLAWNFKSEWGLESQVAFNQMGLCHGLQLRPGNSNSGTDCVPLLEQACEDGKKQIERRMRFQDYFRADSAYCRQEIIKKLLDLGLLFTITAHDGWTKWKSEIETLGLDWQPWIYSPEALKKAAARRRELPRIEVARFFWTPGWSEGDGSKLVFPIIVKRTWNLKQEEERKSAKQASLFHGDGFKEDDPWDYYAVVTNFNLDLSTTTDVDKPAVSGKTKYWKIQEVFEHHQKRGNAENFIREEKYGYDLKHFPCQKLRANHAYALLAMVAHNLLRWVAVLTKPEKPHYSKKLRKRFIHLPAKIVRHARQVYMKLMAHHLKEVLIVRERWGLNSKKSSPHYSSA